MLIRTFLFSCALATFAAAQPVLITAPATINPEATTITPTGGGAPVPLATAEITVRGTTLTVNGRHEIQSLVIERNASNQPGVLTHTAAFSYDADPGTEVDTVNGFHLIVSGDVSIQGADGSLQASLIDVLVRGHPISTGPGTGNVTGCFPGAGGGHGGSGGTGSCSTLRGATYGDFDAPREFGSGGSNRGGVGGGAVRIDCGGTLHIAGTIRAGGGGPCCGYTDGGGSGGSIWLTAESITGTGLVSANGGNGNNPAGGGGGGRIALSWNSGPAFAGTVQAFGGTGGGRGGAGSIFWNAPDAADSLLLFDNNGAAGVTTIAAPLLTDADIEVGAGVALTIPLTESSFMMMTPRNIVIAPGASISVSGRGFGAGGGPGSGNVSGCFPGAGGAHGGQGGRGSCSTARSATYGSQTRPITLGSKGSSGGGGDGGGAARIVAGGDLVLDGSVLAWGNNVCCGLSDGGGAGGSIWIEAENLSGSGLITANGGNGHPNAGGGGGGRIAVYSCNVTLPLANIQVNGGSGFQTGDAGSIFFGSSSIEVSQQPEGGDLRGGDYFQLNVSASSALSDLTYQWRRRNMEGEFVPLVDGERGIFFEVNSSTLFITAIDCQGAGVYDCLICDSCGCFITDAVELSVLAPGDFNQDGGTDGADVEAFFDAWESGLDTADINQDGGVDGADVDFFFYYWEQGC